MKAKLNALDEQIKFFSKLAEQYPLYADTLAKLETERAEVVSQIGRKRMVMRLRSSKR